MSKQDSIYNIHLQLSLFWIYLFCISKYTCRLLGIHNFWTFTHVFKILFLHIPIGYSWVIICHECFRTHLTEGRGPRQDGLLKFSSTLLYHLPGKSFKIMLIEKFDCSFLQNPCPTYKNVTTLQHANGAKLKKLDGMSDRVQLFFILFTLQKSRSHQEQNPLNKWTAMITKNYNLMNEQLPWTLFCLGKNVIWPRNS